MALPTCSSNIECRNSIQSYDDDEDDFEKRLGWLHMFSIFKLFKREPSFCDKYIESLPKHDRTKLRHFSFVKQPIDLEIGVKKFKHWIDIKNRELQLNDLETFPKNILKMERQELNYALRLFVTELKTENEQCYSPDEIHYFCLSIQKYLYDHNHLFNIFADSFFLEFMGFFNEVGKKFTGIYANPKLIIREENMFECKLLGAKSPFVLMTTMIYFNTLYLKLKTIEDHMKLSFNDFKIKHDNRNELDHIQYSISLLHLNKSNTKHRKFEIKKRNNPLRCPVRMFSFYMEKCPENVKHNEDYFYLLPDVTSKPSSSIWFLNCPASSQMVSHIFNRMKLVQEINDIINKIEPKRLCNEIKRE